MNHPAPPLRATVLKVDIIDTDQALGTVAVGGKPIYNKVVLTIAIEITLEISFLGAKVEGYAVQITCPVGITPQVHYQRRIAELNGPEAERVATQVDVMAHASPEVGPQCPRASALRPYLPRRSARQTVPQA